MISVLFSFVLSAFIFGSPLHPCSTSTKRLDTNLTMPLVPAAHRLTSKRCYPFYFPLRAFAPWRDSTSFMRVLPLLNNSTVCDSFNSSHSWFEYSLIPTSEPFDIAHADSESRPTATRLPAHSLRENPRSPFHPCSISSKQLDEPVHSLKSLIFPLREMILSIRNHQRLTSSIVIQ